MEQEANFTRANTGGGQDSFDIASNQTRSASGEEKEPREHHDKLTGSGAKKPVSSGYHSKNNSHMSIEKHSEKQRSTKASPRVIPFSSIEPNKMAPSTKQGQIFQQWSEPQPVG